MEYVLQHAFDSNYRSCTPFNNLRTVQCMAVQHEQALLLHLERAGAALLADIPLPAAPHSNGTFGGARVGLSGSEWIVLSVRHRAHYGRAVAWLI